MTSTTHRSHEVSDPATVRVTRRNRYREMAILVLRRLLLFIPLLVVVSLGIFVLAHYSPFDPLDAYLGNFGDSLTDTDRARLSHELGFDRGWFAQWWAWVTHCLTGDFGISRTYSKSVSDVVMQRLPWSVLLGLLSGIGAFVISFVLGAWAGVRRGGILDRIVSAISVVLQAIPPFVIALAGLAIFGLTLRWLPPGGLTEPGHNPTVASTVRHVILPAVVLTISQLPWLVLSFRESISQILHSDAIRGARMRGIPERVIAIKHILPLGIVPFLTICAARLPELLVGAALVEAIFSWPGIGSALVASAQGLDFALLALLTVLTTAVVLLGNLIADAAAVLLDPRIDADA